LQSIKTELVLDIAALENRKKIFIEINIQLAKTLQILNNKITITTSERKTMSESFLNLEVLTPINKNTQRNDIKIANGAILRIDKALHQKYINYLELTSYNNDIIRKLGESLQQISIQDVSSNFDIVQNKSSTMYKFDFTEIKDNRLLKNAIQKSKRYRAVANLFMDAQMKEAKSLISEIDQTLAKN